MSKITADHLARRACIYIRQSTPDQVRHNLESQRLQYSLADRARGRLAGRRRYRRRSRHLRGGHTPSWI